MVVFGGTGGEGKKKVGFFAKVFVLGAGPDTRAPKDQWRKGKRVCTIA
jgi:hypothetical protein